MSSQENKESMWPDWGQRDEKVFYFSPSVLFFFSERLFATIGTTLYRGAAEPGAGRGKLGRRPRTTNTARLAKETRGSAAISDSLSFVQSEQIACMAFSIEKQTKKPSWVFWGFRISSLAVQCCRSGA